MKYSKSEAKEYAREHMRGIWAAGLTPFRDDLSIDEEGFRANIRHWVGELGIEGLFISGKQGEFFSMSVAERKRTFDIAVEETTGAGATIMSCSDQNMDVVLDLAQHAQNIGADYIVVHAPILHFASDRDDLLRQYYKHISDNVDIGIALWSHPDSGYLMSPELCAELADLPNVVAIKYSVPREMYADLTARASDKLLVSTASEEEWLDNILDLGWQLYLCSSPPYLLQTAGDRRMHDYTQAAFAGEADKAKEIWRSLEPVRHALKSTRPGGKPQAHQKYWQDLLGQVGGRVRQPMLELTEQEKIATRAAFEACGLDVKSAAAE
jgi:4-hydroxy-tetrahydrodipicolinate synthase